MIGYTIRTRTVGPRRHVTYTVCDDQLQLAHITVPFALSADELAAPIIEAALAARRPRPPTHLG